MKNFLPHRRISLTEIFLIPEAYFELTFAWMKVRILTSKNYLAKVEASNSDPNSQSGQSKLIAAVINGLAPRTLWPSTCLIKALATHRMMQKRGIEHQLHFGVTKGKGEYLEAHAWLSVDGEVIVGGENHQSFVEVKRNN